MPFHDIQYSPVKDSAKGPTEVSHSKLSRSEMIQKKAIYDLLYGKFPEERLKHGAGDDPLGKGELPQPFSGRTVRYMPQEDEDRITIPIRVQILFPAAGMSGHEVLPVFTRPKNFTSFCADIVTQIRTLSTKAKGIKNLSTYNFFTSNEFGSQEVDQVYVVWGEPYDRVWRQHPEAKSWQTPIERGLAVETLVHDDNLKEVLTLMENRGGWDTFLITIKVDEARFDNDNSLTPMASYEGLSVPELPQDQPATAVHINGNGNRTHRATENGTAIANGKPSANGGADWHSSSEGSDDRENTWAQTVEPYDIENEDPASRVKNEEDSGSAIKQAIDDENFAN